MKKVVTGLVAKIVKGHKPLAISRVSYDGSDIISILFVYPTYNVYLNVAPCIGSSTEINNILK